MPAKVLRVLVAPRYKRGARLHRREKNGRTTPQGADRIRLTEPERRPLLGEESPRKPAEKNVAAGLRFTRACDTMRRVILVAKLKQLSERNNFQRL